MIGISPWAIAASVIFAGNELNAVYEHKQGIYNFNIYLADDSLWLLATWPAGGKVAFRLAYSPGDGLAIDKCEEKEQSVFVALTSVIGDFTVNIFFPSDNQSAVRYVTNFTPRTDLFIPFWPKDIII